MSKPIKILDNRLQESERITDRLIPPTKKYFVAGSAFLAGLKTGVLLDVAKRNIGVKETQDLLNSILPELEGTLPDLEWLPKYLEGEIRDKMQK